MDTVIIGYLFLCISRLGELRVQHSFVEAGWFCFFVIQFFRKRPRFEGTVDLQQQKKVLLVVMCCEYRTVFRHSGWASIIPEPHSKETYCWKEWEPWFQGNLLLE